MQWDGKQSGQREAALLRHWVSSGRALEGYKNNLPQPRPLPWAQHERAFNELSENFLLFLQKMQKSTNLLEIKYELAVPCLCVGRVNR